MVDHKRVMYSVITSVDVQLLQAADKAAAERAAAEEAAQAALEQDADEQAEAAEARRKAAKEAAATFQRELKRSAEVSFRAIAYSIVGCIVQAYQSSVYNRRTVQLTLPESVYGHWCRTPRGSMQAARRTHSLPSARRRQTQAQPG